MQSLRPLATSGLSNPLHNPTLLSDEGMGPRRVCREHYRVLDTQPDDKKPLTYAGYCDHRRVCRVLYPISIAVAGSSLANCILDVRN